MEMGMQNFWKMEFTPHPPPPTIRNLRVIKSQTELQKFQKFHNNIIQRQLQITNEHDKEIPKERYVSAEERQNC